MHERGLIIFPSYFQGGRGEGKELINKGRAYPSDGGV